MLIIIVFLLIVNLLYSEQSISINNVKVLGMGGVSLGISGDENPIFYNASGLAKVKKPVLIAPYISFETDTKTFDLLSYVLSHQNELSNGFSGITNQTVDKLTNADVKLGMHLGFGCVQRNFGLGFFVPLNVFAQGSSGIFIPRADVYATGDMLLISSFGYPFSTSIGEIDAGLSLKLIYRTKVDEKRTVLEWSALSTNPIKFQSYWGVGFDVSGMYELSKDLRLSLVIQDIFTRIGSSTLPLNVKLGLAYFSDIKLENLFKDIRFYFDIVDLFNPDDAKYLSSFGNTTAIFLKKTHIGIESKLIDFVNLRIGLNQGYPTFGIGLKIEMFNIEYAFYGKEEGVFPGDIPSWNHILTFVFRY
ncbi:MAG: hypothetical protein ABH873_06960 [Candidatus Firestonebacteria bacterium]